MSEISKNVQAVLNGDKNAFKALYGATSRAVYFTCLSLTRNETDAEDIMQEVYIIAFAKRCSSSTTDMKAALFFMTMKERSISRRSSSPKA